MHKRVGGRASKRVTLSNDRTFSRGRHRQGIHVLPTVAQPTSRIARRRRTQTRNFCSDALDSAPSHSAASPASPIELFVTFNLQTHAWSNASHTTGTHRSWKVPHERASIQ